MRQGARCLPVNSREDTKIWNIFRDIANHPESFLYKTEAVIQLYTLLSLSL